MQDLHAVDGSKDKENDAPRPRGGTALQIWSMCFALFGIQIVWGLQNANTSRIFQTLGANVAELPLLWIAGPVTGLIVQPIVGHLSDHSRSRFGRRRPFLLGGGLLSALALLIMPNAHSLWTAIGALWLLTASINIAMDPSRALVADNLPEAQRARGYAIQVFFIGVGAVFASSLPWMLVHWFGVSGNAAAGVLPPAVRYAFYIGSACLLLSVLWTVLSTKEAPGRDSEAPQGSAPKPVRRLGWPLAIAGAILLAAAMGFGWQWEIVVLAAAALILGLAHGMAARRQERGDAALGLLEIVEDFLSMPAALRRLATVQFFTWFGLFAMWIYAVPAVARLHFGGGDPASGGFNAAADWVGILFAGYNGVAAIAALLLPAVVVRMGERTAYAACLLAAAGGMAGFVLIADARWLWLTSLGIGLGWAAILSLPYAIIVNAVPSAKVGVYLGIHNVFLVIPQLVAAVCLGPLVRRIFGGDPVPALWLAALFLGIAAVASLRLPQAGRSP